MSEHELWNELGNIYYNTGAYDQAIRTYQKVIELYPKCGQYYSNLASIFVIQERYAEAITMFQKGIELLDKAIDKAFLWNQLGDAYRKVEDYAQAEVAYRKAIELDPGNTAFQMNLAEVQASSWASDSAPVSDHFIPVNPGISIAGDLPEEGQACWVFKDDIDPFTRQEFLSNTQPQSPMRLGNRLLSDETVDESVTQKPTYRDDMDGFEKSQSQAPGNPATMNTKGLQTSRNGDVMVPAHPEETRRAFSIGPRTLLAQGIWDWRKGEHEKAVRLLIEGIEAAEKTQDLLIEALCFNGIARIKTDLGEIEQAIQAYQSAVNLAPEQIFPWNDLGFLNYRLARYEDARAAFLEAIEHNPMDPVSWNGLGDVYHKMGYFEEAIAAYQRSNGCEKEPVEQDAFDAFVYHMFADQKTPPDGVEIQSQSDGTIESDEPADPVALEMKPSTPAVDRGDPQNEPPYWMFTAGNSRHDLQEQEKHDQRTNTGTIVKTAKPLPALSLRTHYEKAFSCNQVSQDNAADPASVLVQLTPRPLRSTPKIAINNQVTGQAQMGNTPETLADTQKIRPVPSSSGSRTFPSQSGAPDSDQADMSSADSHILEKDISAYRRVTELNPKNDRAWDTLGNMYEGAGLHSEAVSAFEKAIDLDPHKESYHYHLGIALAYLKRYDEAIPVFQRVLVMNSNFILAHCAIAGAYRRLGREAEAQEHMQIAEPSMENENEYNRACFQSISGDADKAFAYLEIALSKRQVKQALVCSDPDLDFIRKDPRFDALLHKNGMIS